VVSEWKVQALATHLRFLFFFLQGIFQQVSGSRTIGLCIGMLRAVGASIFVVDVDPMVKRKS